MGIYIPNTKMPKSCYNHCLEDFIANEEIGCPLKNYKESHQYKNAIHPNCPLIEIVRCGECKWKDECILGSYGVSEQGFGYKGERRADERITE